MAGNARSALWDFPSSLRSSVRFHPPALCGVNFRTALALQSPFCPDFPVGQTLVSFVKGERISAAIKGGGYFPGAQRNLEAAFPFSLHAGR